MLTVALLFVMGGALLVRPHLARAISVAPSVNNGMSGTDIIGAPYIITSCTDLQNIDSARDAYYEAASTPGKGTAITLTWPS